MTSNSTCEIAIYVHESIICTFSVITNLLSITVFLHPKMNDPSFIYMLAVSVSDLFYTGFNLHHFIYFCSDFYLNKYFATQIFDLYFRSYMARCLSVFGILAEIFLSIQRYMTILNKPYLIKSAHKWLLLFLSIVSLIYNLPLLFYKEIVPIKMTNSTHNIFTLYKTVNNIAGLSSFASTFNILLSAGRIFLFPFIMTLINIFNAVELKKRLKAKRTIESQVSTLGPSKLLISNNS